MDASDGRHKGVLSADDLAGFAATVEPPATCDYHGWTVAKKGPWGQGPVLLESLALRKGFDLAGLESAGAVVIPLLIGAMKLAYADREIVYGGPKCCSVPPGVWESVGDGKR